VGSARFQVVTGIRTPTGLVPPWPVVAAGTAAPAAGGAPADATDRVWFGWRLLSRNHRDLARSPVVHPTEADCADAVERFRAVVAAGTTALSRDPRTGRWTWWLETPDGVVATGSRGYLRRRECHDCVAQVLALAPTALAPEPGEALVRPRSRA
jgi:hypothetical protein